LLAPGQPNRTNGSLFGEKERTIPHKQVLREKIDMAKGEQRSNRETKKPKKEKIKTIAAAPSQKTGGWQPTQGTGKKK
jgi:hypothetical protein